MEQDSYFFRPVNRVPIIQGPLDGLSTQRLTATVSNCGGLGSFGAHGLSPSAIKNVISEIGALTSRPFAINLCVSTEDKGVGTSDSKAFARSLEVSSVPRPEGETRPMPATSVEIGIHLRPEWLFMMVRNTHFQPAASRHFMFSTSSDGFGYR